MQYDTTRVYLNRVIPWVQDAFVTVHHTVPNANFDPAKPKNSKTNNPTWLRGQAFRTADEVVNYIRYISGRPDTLDVYIGMSAQGRAQERAGRMGRPYFVAQRAKVWNLGMRALFMDLDVKADDLHAYPTQEALFAAFKAFLKNTGLPVPTMLVASGTGGAHAYWCLDRVIHVDEWSPLANALAEATRREGFRCDTQCIVDTVRILRPPETWNRKRDTPLPVQMAATVQPHDITVEQIRAILQPYHGAKVIDLSVARRATAKDANDELLSGISAASAAPIDIRTVVKSCGFIHEALATGGAAFKQPLWNIGTLTASFMVGRTGSGVDLDGRAIAHAMARGHVAYVPADTDALYDRKTAERQSQNLGWPSCKAIENAGCTSCGSCQFRAFGKSPLSWGRAFSSAPTPPANNIITPPLSVGSQWAQAANMPPGYVATGDGRINKMVLSEKGETTLRPVSPYAMEGAYLQSNPWVLFFQTRLGPTPKLTTIAIALANLQSREFAKHLAALGMVTNPDAARDLQEFLLSWVSELQKLAVSIQSSPFGWSIDHGRIEGFVFGGRCWMPGADRAAAVPHEVIAAQFAPHGDLAEWKRACDFITAQNRPALNAILAASFGAPLMRFTGMSGAIVSAYSTASGIGKTTTMEVAQAVWGHPRKGMNSLDDTQNSVVNKAGQLRNIPLMWDELKGSDQKTKFVRLAFQITGGKEKSRLNADAVQRDPGTWQTLVVAASNDSLLDAIQRELKTTEAGLLRVFEYAVEPSRHPTTRSHGYVSRLVAQCQDHHGVAGLEYAKFLGANFKRIGDEVAQCQDHVVAQLNSANDERFWIATITCMMMGARYAKELGLADIDARSLFAFLRQTLIGLRGMRLTTNVDINRPDALANILATYLVEMRGRYTLTTDTMPAPGHAAKSTKVGDHSKLETVLVRSAVDDKMVSIAKEPFLDWLARREMSPNAVLQSLKSVFYAKTVQRELTAGTDFGGVAFRRSCIDIDYGATALAALIEG